jgi:hypothetical protein
LVVSDLKSHMHWNSSGKNPTQNMT